MTDPAEVPESQMRDAMLTLDAAATQPSMWFDPVRGITISLEEPMTDEEVEILKEAFDG